MRSVFIALSSLFLCTNSFASEDTVAFQSQEPFSLKFESSDISQILPYVDEKTLLLLDLDNTVHYTKSSLGSANWCVHLGKAKIKEGFEMKEAIALIYPSWMKYQYFTEYLPVDERIPSMIRDLQTRQMAVLALTARQPIAAVATLKQLKSLNIDFSDNPFKDLSFHFATKDPAAFFDGVIFSSEYNSKLIILDQFLALAKAQGKTYERIVMVDDKQNNIDDVEIAALAHGLQYIGLRYSALDESVSSFNPFIAKAQLEYLEHLLPDDVAEEMLKTSEGQEYLKLYVDPVDDSSTKDEGSVGASFVKSYDNSSQEEVVFLETDTIADLLDLCDERTLVVFDINDTLMTTRQALGSDVWLQSLIKDKMAQGMSKEEVLDRILPLWHRILIRSTYLPVETDTAFVMYKLLEKRCPIIGLTARYVEMAYPTVEQLHSLFIDFSESSLADTHFFLSTPYPAKFLHGIIFAGLQNKKNEVLCEFWNQKGLDYDKIIFIDDKKKNVEDMSLAAKQLGKPYIGIWYRAIEKLGPINSDISKLQSVFFDRIVPDSLLEQLKYPGYRELAH